MEESQKKTAKRHLMLIALGVIGALVLLSLLSIFVSGH